MGPTPEQIRSFGLKHTSREIAQAHGVPLLPGSGLLSDLEEAQREAARIGYPVMLKSTAGGGGIGMQLCENPGELAAKFETVRNLGRNNFKDDGLYLEKFVSVARHLEVQIFGDGRGQVIALGERDCSTQRRHQKVIEETPAPHLSEEHARSFAPPPSASARPSPTAQPAPSSSSTMPRPVPSTFSRSTRACKSSTA